MQKNIDWFGQLKIDIVKLCISFNMLKQDIVILLVTNNWILEDINLFENYVKLQEMIEISEKDLDSLIDEIKNIEDNAVPFLVDDIVSEFNFVSENIDLELFYLLNMSLYMVIVDDYSLNSNQITELFDNYFDIDTLCYNHMKTNNEQLKILKKERGDYFE